MGNNGGGLQKRKEGSGEERDDLVGTGLEIAEWGKESWVTHSPSGRYCRVLTLELWALVTLALSPGSTDTPAAIFLLGEARQGVAATLEEYGA